MIATLYLLSIVSTVLAWLLAQHKGEEESSFDFRLFASPRLRAFALISRLPQPVRCSSAAAVATPSSAPKPAGEPAPAFARTMVSAGGVVPPWCVLDACKCQCDGCDFIAALLRKARREIGQ
jgi:hypothetical protein